MLIMGDYSILIRVNTKCMVTTYNFVKVCRLTKFSQSLRIASKRLLDSKYSSNKLICEKNEKSKSNCRVCRYWINYMLHYVFE